MAGTVGGKRPDHYKNAPAPGPRARVHCQTRGLAGAARAATLSLGLCNLAGDDSRVSFLYAGRDETQTPLQAAGGAP
jgi:hypothetical protein